LLAMSQKFELWSFFTLQHSQEMFRRFIPWLGQFGKKEKEGEVA